MPSPIRASGFSPAWHRRRFLRDVALAVLVLLGAVLPWGAGAMAQTPAPLRPLAPAAQARAGVHLVQTGRPAAAQRWLRRAVVADSALMLSDHGAAAYWLGEAYARTGDSVAARAAWIDGLRRLDRAGGFDVRLADAYLRSLTPAQLRAGRLRAVDQYRRLLGRVGPDTAAAVTAVFRRRMAQLAPLLPDDVFAAAVRGSRTDAPEAWTFRGGAGPALQRWWRSLDPFPKTPENERLEEHLTRLVRAQRAFACPERPSALDQRGLVHLRLGTPQTRRVLRYKSGEFFREVFRFGVPLPPSSFPAAELWLYPQIDDADGYFLFAEGDRAHCYHVATANDLLPSTLKMRRGDTERGLNIAYSSLMAQRAIYRELALYHSDFAPRYDEIAGYAGWQEMKATVARMGGSPGGSTQQTTVGAGIGQTRIVSSNPVLGIPPPTDFVGRILSEAKRTDRRAARERTAAMPRQRTSFHDDMPRLPVALRTARTLTPGGGTRVTLYWGVRSAAAALPAPDTSAQAPSTLTLAATQYDSTWTALERRTHRHPLPADPARRGPFIVPAPLTFDMPAASSHLSLRWTQYRRWTRSGDPISPFGPRRRVAVARLDSLRPLRTRGPLEMSDLTVQVLPDTTAMADTPLRARATPHPFRTVTPDTPLLLTFELYHLARTTDGDTRYTVSYEVTGRTRRGWTRLFRDPDTRRTATETTVEGTRRRTEESILLALAEVARPEVQAVRVVVRVTDRTTGATERRTVDFVLRPRSGS